MIFSLNNYIDEGLHSAPVLVLAHGAGASMNSPFMELIATKLVEQGIRVVRFNFGYMQQIEREHKKRPPAKMPQLMDEFKHVLDRIAATTDAPIFMGGKSMGGRVATLLMNDERQRIKGCVCLGYTFHPVGKPQTLRTEHLAHVPMPLCVVQGTRDAFGNIDEVQRYALDSSIHITWLMDGDHDLSPRKASGFTHEQHMKTAAMTIAGFMKARSEGN